MKNYKTKLIVILFCISMVAVWFMSKTFYNFDAEKFNANYLKVAKRGWEQQKDEYEKQITKLEAEELENTNPIPNCIKEKISPLTKQERAMLYTIKNYHSEIEVPENITTSYFVDDEQYPIATRKLNYQKDSESLYFGTYIYYDIKLREEENMVNLEYNYSGGTASTSFGTISYNKFTKEVIKTDFTYSQEAGLSIVYINGVELRGNFHTFKNY